MKLRSFATAMTMTTALLGGMLVATPAASASTSAGYISGVDTLTDDWGDEGPLSTNSYPFSRAVALWQGVLKAEGLYTGAIDCAFGPATKSATAAYQSRYGLTADGIAGPLTMGYADRYLVAGSSDFVNYDVARGSATFRRTGGAYYVYLSGAWRTASYVSSTGC
ncbi:peptidoglycan-binding protein [Micromonospora sp. NPDC006431]|uniref:peptidoglycan-binding domain-containing protein n=1 Tax=Micromonospora sp. NPDC006431 TaxID=3364235 RepID=UPI00367E813B